MPRQVSLLTCQDVFDVFVCSMCLRQKCSIKEKFKFKRGEDVSEEVEEFCSLGGMFSSYGAASEGVHVRIDSVWKKFRELGEVFVGK